MTIYVLDIAGKPLMPTHKPGKVRHMLNDGRAIIVNYYPFTIKLTYVTTNYVQPVTLGIDAGSVHIGVSASTEKKELYSAEIDLRSKEMSKLIEKRTEARGKRRYNLRYREPRFDNRVSTKKYRWLPPSINHRINSHIRIVEDVMKILPISKVIIEVGLFDTQKISNPEISREEYQNGQMKGFDNTKAFVRFRDKNTCQQCGSKEHVEVHHIQHQKDYGPDRPDNLICLCHKCHYDHHNNGLVLKTFRTINKKNAVSLRDAAAMNLIKDRIFSKLKELHSNIPIWRTYGYVTKHNRRKHNIDKSHANDAFVIAKNFNAEPLDYMFRGFQVRRHNRKIHKDNILKGGKLKKNQSEHLMFGFARFDRVKYDGKECFVYGRRTSGYFDLRDIDGSKIHATAPVRKTNLIRHENSIIIKKIKKDCADSSADAKDVAVSSAHII
jgi:hypothetical protein